MKVDAIFQDGVFKPVSPPELHEGERVQLSIERQPQERVGEIGSEARGAALSRLRAGIRGMNFCSPDRLPSRDESHDRS